MTTNSTLIHNLTPEEISNQFQELQNQLAEIRNNFQPKQPTEYLTRSELAEMLRCDLSTVHNWTKKGKLRAYGMGNRVYYKRQEVESGLVPLTKDQF